MKKKMTYYIYPETRFNLLPYLMLYFFIISQAYVGTVTDDGLSCWAELSSMLSISILIKGTGKLFVTFVKGFVKTWNQAITESLAWSTAKYSKPSAWIKCGLTKMWSLMSTIEWRTHCILSLSSSQAQIRILLPIQITYFIITYVYFTKYMLNAK